MFAVFSSNVKKVSTFLRMLNIEKTLRSMVKTKEKLNMRAMRR